LRTDLRLWEQGKQEESSNEKNRLEINQRERKKKLKEKFAIEKPSVSMDEDKNYYTPKFFHAV
jgi:hypothetical protein